MYILPPALNTEMKCFCPSLLSLSPQFRLFSVILKVVLQAFSECHCTFRLLIRRSLRPLGTVPKSRDRRDPFKNSPCPAISCRPSDHLYVCLRLSLSLSVSFSLFISNLDFDKWAGPGYYCWFCHCYYFCCCCLSACRTVSHVLTHTHKQQQNMMSSAAVLLYSTLLFLFIFTEQVRFSFSNTRISVVPCEWFRMNPKQIRYPCRMQSEGSTCHNLLGI